MVTPWGFESPLSHQSNIIRTKSSQWEMGSDYLFSSDGSRKPISETVSSNDPDQSPEGQEKRNSFRRTLLWIRSAVVSIIFPFLLASSGCLYLLGHVCPRQFLAGSMGLCGFLLVGLSLAHRHFHFFTVPSLSPGWVGLCALLIAFCCHQFHHLLYHCAYAEMQVI